MIIQPKTRGFICTTAHPLGCAANVNHAVDHMQAGGELPDMPKNVLVLGASTGYGLASRIATAFVGGAATLGISFEKEPTERKTASPGWYNSLAFDAAAKRQGLYSKTLNLDAFSNETKEQVIDLIKTSMGPIDLIIYSLASPVRKDPETGHLYRSVIKPIGVPCQIKGLNVDNAKIIDSLEILPASEEEIANTVKVMGGEDWYLWINQLKAAEVLAEGCRTLAYTYIGSELTWPIYRYGTIGRAKDHLDQSAEAINQHLSDISGEAKVVALKAIVTQASAAIPAVPLYNSLLFRVMKDFGLHEDSTAHINRLFRALYGEEELALDEMGRIRRDQKELSEQVQVVVNKLWLQVTTENLYEITDFAGFRKDFLRIFGFEVDGVDYQADISPLWVPSL